MGRPKYQKNLNIRSFMIDIGITVGGLAGVNEQQPSKSGLAGVLGVPFSLGFQNS
jgi:hypothetical protein